MWESTWMDLSSTALCCDLPFGFLGHQKSGNFNKKLPVNESSGNVVRTYTYSHHQHMKALKHLKCAFHYNGSPLEWVYSLNHHTMLWFVPWEVPEFWATPSLRLRSSADKSISNVVRTQARLIGGSSIASQCAQKEKLRLCNAFIALVALQGCHKCSAPLALGER